MKPGQPSRTAVRVALRRAAHQILDKPLVFDDPLALQMVGQEVAAALQKDPARFESQLGAPVLRAFLAARSRIAEDALAKAIRNGTRQYVVLGAGMDTYAYRQQVAGLRVFEVDQPATQDWKRMRLTEVGLAVPESLTFVSVDFEQQVLADELERAGLDRAQPTFFSWLGVTPYLTKDAVWRTLETVAAFTRAGGGMTFDYAVPADSLNFLQRAAFAVLAKRVEEAGEPFQSFFDPSGLNARLQAMGFATVRDRDADAINAKYFADRSDGLAVGAIGHVVTAWAQ